MKKFNSNKGSITKNLKIIEWLKSELLGNVSTLFKTMVKENEFELLDVLVSIIMTTYLLARRLGYSFNQIDRQLERKLKRNIDNKHQIETWYGDLGDFLEHFRKRN